VTPEQIADRESVWQRVAVECPEFTRAHDWSDNYHAVREIVLSGSLTWRMANGYFHPWKGKRVMDIGANAGVYTAFCAVHGATVIAYEPFPKVFSQLSQMIVATGLGNLVAPLNAAVWTYTGEIPYIGHTTSNEDVRCFNGGVPTNGIKWTRDDYRESECVKCVSFDDAIGDVDWDCVKMDIEGAEFEVLLTASIDALKRVKFMYLELHDWVSRPLYDETLKKLESVFKCEYFRCEPTRERFEAAYLFRK